MSSTETRDLVKKIFEAYLENKSLRKTPERFAILEEIYSRNDHFDVESLYIHMKNKKYRVLLRFVQSQYAGLIKSLFPFFLNLLIRPNLLFQVTELKRFRNARSFKCTENIYFFRNLS